LVDEGKANTKAVEAASASASAPADESGYQEAHDDTLKLEDSGGASTTADDASSLANAKFGALE